MKKNMLQNKNSGKIKHDIRNSLTIMTLSLEAFDCDSLTLPQKGQFKDLVKILDKEINRITRILK